MGNGWSYEGNKWLAGHIFSAEGKVLKGAAETAIGTISLGLIGSPSGGVKEIESGIASGQEAVSGPVTKSEEIAKQNQKNISSGAQWWANTPTAVKSAYSGNMSTVTRPSSLMAITDPQTRMAIASTRGAARGAVQQAGARADLQMHPALANATTSAGPPTSTAINQPGADSISTDKRDTDINQTPNS